MSHTAMNLVTYVARAIDAGDFQPVVDKKGVTFFRVEPGKHVWWNEGREDELFTEIKSAAVYRRKNESLQILANIGGLNSETGKKWARGVHITLKPVNPACTVVLEGKKRIDWIERDTSNRMRDRLVFT